MKLALTALLLATMALSIPAPEAAVIRPIPDPPKDLDDTPKPATNTIVPKPPAKCVFFGDACVYRVFGEEDMKLALATLFLATIALAAPAPAADPEPLLPGIDQCTWLPKCIPELGGTAACTQLCAAKGLTFGQIQPCGFLPPYKVSCCCYHK
ncbi:uncharacterized protein LOC62_03G003627 [Vanrija pseudolonga]|uniref:Uncharacterized protein n=1 Tax=Vanrija pseudolonga TaxID=143232 RepID=A0AAF0Y9B5_9TREE|nr:hypothetical protein LOC62_03G003627 [Vanrija pseudolonga]